MSQAQFYLVFYTVLVLVTGVAVYLKLIPPDILIVALSSVFGHGAGLFQPSPASRGSEPGKGDQGSGASGERGGV